MSHPEAILTVAPYLSVVVATRNDDHGGDPLRRLQALVNSFDAQCRRTGLAAELIVVEWNPPGDRPRVSRCCACRNRQLRYRFIDVPAEPHQQLRLPRSAAVPDDRRTSAFGGRAAILLATNIDIIFD
jgi:hypothetical protein